MTSHLVSQLSAKQQDIIIVDTCFSDAISSAKDIKYHDQPHRELQKIEESARSNIRHLYAPIYTKNHYIALEIDFHIKCFRWGDSLNSNQQALESLIKKLQWWFSGRFGQEFDNRRPTLPHGNQKDQALCALFTINTIEHNIFGHTLGVANPACERVRWFCLTSETQLLESEVSVPVSNEQAQTQEVEQGPYRIQKITRETLVKEKAQQDKIKLAKRLERKRLEHERLEHERLEHEIHDVDMGVTSPWLSSLLRSFVSF
ncbi:hypothetical protein EDD22DRAFT_849482 [Suillus occidentalis]|nr:hypothetical protein EDD22DRAFT_849482 [Suillus occidentalis]